MAGFIPTPAPTGNSSQPNTLDSAINNNPGIKDPGTVANIANQQDPNAAASLINHTTLVSSAQQAVQDNAAQHGNDGFWQGLFGGAGKVVTGALNWLNKPLQEVQQDYKFIHSVWAKHGAFEGMLTALGVAGGATLGALVAGPEGALAGADLAGEGERKIASMFGNTWRDSLTDATNPNYQVSFGRDVAQGLGQIPGFGALKNTNQGMGKVISGLGDTAFDFALDPINVGLGVRSAIKGGNLIRVEGEQIVLSSRLARSIVPGIEDALARNSLKVYSPDQLDALYQAGQKPNLFDMASGNAGMRYNRALQDIADTLNTTKNAKAATQGIATVGVKYPMLESILPMLKPSAEITANDVHKAFISAVADQSLTRNGAGTALTMVPNRTVVRAALSNVSDKLRQWDANDSIYLQNNRANFFVPRFGVKQLEVIDGQVRPVIDPSTNLPKTSNIMPVVLRPWAADGWKTAIAGKTRTFSSYLPFTIDSKLLELSNTKFDPNSADAYIPVYRIARYSLGDQLAKQKASEFIMGDTKQKFDIYHSLLSEMMKAAGLPDDQNLMSKIMDDSAKLAEGPLARTNYGYGFDSGRKASEAVVKDRTVRQGVFEDQQGKFSMPDFRAVKTAMRAMGRYGKIYGSVDDFAAKYTEGIFKPQALLTGGFALRIGVSELLPAIFRFGSTDIAKSIIAKSATKMNYKLAKGEDLALLENAMKAVSAGTNPEEYFARLADTEGKRAAGKVQEAYNTYRNVGAGEYLKQAAQGAEGKTIRKAVAKGASALASESDLDLASRIAIATRGHIGTGATFTGYGIPAEHAEWLKQFADVMGQDAKRSIPTGTGKYVSYTPADSRFPLHYTTLLGKSATFTSRRQIVSDALDELKKGATENDAWKTAQLKDEARIRGLEYNPNPNAGTVFGEPVKKDLYAAERKVMVGYQNENPTDFAARRTDIMRNLFTDSTGTSNKTLMKKIAAGQKPTLKEIQYIPIEKLPKNPIEGEEYVFMPGPNVLQRIVNGGFEKVIDPVINNISREPLFFNNVKNELKSFDYAVNTGKLSEEEALRGAMTRATKTMVPQIHNTALRTQFSVLARNVFPFYFAQEQAMRRAGALILSNPEAFRKYQLVQQGMNNPAFVTTDANGNKVVTIPGLGELGGSFMNAAAHFGLQVVPGLPVNVAGSMQSLKTVVPELNVPGVSPFVSISADALGSFDPVLQREINKITGGYSSALFDQLIPNSVARTVYHAAAGDETESSFYSAVASSLAAAAASGKLPNANSSPVEQQQFLDRIKNNARSMMIMKALLGMVSPLSPAVTQENNEIRNEFYKILDNPSATGGKMTWPEAVQEFINEHGTAAISYTVSRSEGTVAGSTIPYTNNAINWIQNNQKLLSSNDERGVAAAFLIPQTTSGGGDAQAIHDEVIKMNLRENKTPTQLLQSYYVAAGNNYVAAQRTVYENQLQSAINNGESTTALRSAWSAFTTAYGKTNPIWWNDYTSQDRVHVANEAITGMQKLFTNKSLNQIGQEYGDQAKLTAQLYMQWQGYNAELANLRLQGGTGEITALKDSWQTYVKQIAADVPQLNTVVNSVFARL